MQYTFRGTTLTVLKGDLTDQQVAAIINPASPRLDGSRGLDSFIHQKAGEILQAACLQLRTTQDEYPPGTALLTPAGDLPAEWVIHTVCPRWQDGTRGELIDLERCYTKSLERAAEQGAKTIATPVLGTGVNGFALDRAAYVAFNAINRFVVAHPDALTDVRFVFFDDEDHKKAAAIADDVMKTMVG
jgi:O-acetyl-ADP-ribose deacetylase (regulator of RNase III)